MSSRSVYKFSVRIDDAWHEIKLSPRAKVLHVGQQEDGPWVYFWAEVDPDNLTETRTFRIYPTGGLIEADAAYLGTAQDHTRGYVWHLYVRPLYARRSPK
jgi:hypothetical protein